MGDTGNQMAAGQNRSMLREFIASLATMSGDLSNITAPPFVLDTKSTVELPSFWAENPSIFCAPTLEEDPAKRALLVLKWYLSCLRNQNYMGHSEEHGVKKPLNGFLGELFLARWEDAMGTTRLVSEQVSHHPPITACQVWNDTHGVSASGYTRQTITFNGQVSIAQTGHAVFRLAKRHEAYLIPLPTLKVKGVLSGSPYPELSGKYYIPSTSGYMSVIEFSGKSFLGWGEKHGLHASVFHEEDGESNILYEVNGNWHKKFVIRDMKAGKDFETFDVVKQSDRMTRLTVDPVEEQDPWETRNAWGDVISALNNGDMKGTTDAKSVVEQGQRNMRKDEKKDGITWSQAFFTSEDDDEVADALMQKVPGNESLAKEKARTKGVWTFNQDAWDHGVTKPYHGELLPNNQHRADWERRRSTSTVASDQSPRMSIDQDLRRASVDHLWMSESLHSPTISSRRSSLPNTPVSRNDRHRPSTLSHELSSSEMETMKNFHKDNPQPQTEQVRRILDQREEGSGIDGMSVCEKVTLENRLRDLHMTGSP